MSVLIYFVECEVSSHVAGKSILNHQSSLNVFSFFTETQLIALEPTFRKWKIPKLKSKNITPVCYDTSSFLFIHLLCLSITSFLSIPLSFVFVSLVFDSVVSSSIIVASTFIWYQCHLFLPMLSRCLFCFYGHSFDSVF